MSDQNMDKIEMILESKEKGPTFLSGFTFCF